LPQDCFSSPALCSGKFAKLARTSCLDTGLNQPIPHPSTSPVPQYRIHHLASNGQVEYFFPDGREQELPGFALVVGAVNAFGVAAVEGIAHLLDGGD